MAPSAEKGFNPGNGSFTPSGSDPGDGLHLEKQLSDLASQAIIGRITPELIHDINNHLTGILGYSELLLMKKIGDPGIANGLKNIYTSAEKCKVLLDSLLALSRTDSSRISLVNINEAIEKTLDLRSCSLRHQQIELSRALGEKIPVIPLDIHRFKKTFLNLVFKAEESLGHKPEGKKLLIQTAHNLENDTVEIMIRENGSGMSYDGLSALPEANPMGPSQDLGNKIGFSDALHWIDEVGGRIALKRVGNEETTVVLNLPVKGKPDEG